MVHQGISNSVIIGCIFFTFLGKLSAQGIKFDQDLVWKQILEKAKKENKYIFVDCFTTWCGPCKAMDKDVYPVETVGNFFNENFISVKLQMDKSKSDNDIVKRKYEDAKLLETNYKIFSFPTYLFFSPDGILTHKDYGLKQPAEFIAVAKIALIPGKVYKDPFEDYNIFIAEYQSGKKNYKKIPYMIDQARKAMDWQTLETLTKDYYQYLQTQPENVLYKKENLLLISSLIKSSKDPFFHLFFPNENKANKIIGNSFFCANVVDPIILNEEADSLLGTEGSMTNVIQRVIPVANSEPDWNYLFTTIKSKYNEDYAIRNVLNAKIKWYSNYQWWPQWITSSIEKLNRFGVDTTNELEDVMLADLGWKAFLQCNDSNQLKDVVKWTKDVCMRNRLGEIWTTWDTYANLLYKIGKRKEALKWEKKALQSAKDNNDKKSIKPFGLIIQTMQAGKPTWINYDEIISKPFSDS